MNFLKNITPRTWLIIVIVILAIIFIAVLISKNRKSTITTTTIVQPPAPTYAQGDNFPLQQGSRGERVKRWQAYLNTKGANLQVDGIWGPLTEAASIKYMGFNSVTEQYYNTVIK